MELVYLWVEKYKNIKEQRFNFSSRFECKYENNELTICDKKKDECTDNNYIENFFGHNINVTAIVGKNGSGKSNIINLLYKELNDYDFHGFAIFHSKDKNFFLKSLDDTYSCLDIYTNISESNQDIKFLLFDYSCNSIEYNSKNKFPKNSLSENLNNIIWNYIDIKENNKWSIFEKYFQPEIIQVNITNIIFNLANEYEKSNFGEAVQQVINEIIEDFEKENHNIALEKIIGLGYSIEHSPAGRDSNKLSKKDFLQEFNLTFNEIGLPKTLIEKNKYRFIRNLIVENQNTFQNYSEPYRETINIIDVEVAKNLNTISSVPKKYRYAEKLDSDKMYHKQETIFEWEISDLNFDEINIIMNFFQNTFYKIDLISKQKISLDKLSFGEKQLIFILNQIYRLAVKTDEDNLIILLDEIDIGFHPDWQKRTIQYIIDFLSLIPDKNFHLIFTTHSPFLLSDIPKENIIFLENGKQIKGIKKQTFGANIHTLLSDSFFMEDGLMGEFAKSKINEIIDFHKKVEEEGKTGENIQFYNEQQKSFGRLNQ